MAETRTFKFRSRPEAVAAARKALHGFDEHLEAGSFYDASLCVSELVTNAVLHADIADDEELRLDVSIEAGGRLRVAVTDSGRGFSPPAPMAEDESGWGLFIVDRLSDRWGVEHEHGTMVWFEMRVPGLENVGIGDTATLARRGGAGEGAEGSTGRRAVGRLRLGPQATG